LRCEAYYAVFIFDHINGKGVCVICIITWHVNDKTSKSNAAATAHMLDRHTAIAERFGISDLGPVSKYLRVQFVRDRKTRELWMHQM
ncbi:hypothetical protein P692DRAFT_201688198, partial [Suillus brevipes Sb2]